MFHAAKTQCMQQRRFDEVVSHQTHSSGICKEIVQTGVAQDTSKEKKFIENRIFFNFFNLKTNSKLNKRLFSFFFFYGKGTSVYI